MRARTQFRPTEDHRPHRRQRRGIVLVLILAMLGLMAVIGVTFATFSGQTQAGARFYVQAADELDPQRVIDFAMGQLINDTDNPISPLRGHSLKADMYGNDARNHGYFPTLPDGRPILVTAVAGTSPEFIITTNIPGGANSYAFPELDRPLIGWTLRLEVWQYNQGFPVQQLVPPVAQTFQIFDEDVVNNLRRFALTTSDTQSVDDNGVALLVQPDQLGNNPLGNANFRIHVKLDNRYRNAFNGTGMGGNGVFANFRVNGPIQDFLDFQAGRLPADNNPFGGLGRPSDIGMDEDYDAADLDNWFIALKSADGSVLIPSFHRPSVVRLDTNIDDWTSYPATAVTNYSTLLPGDRRTLADVWSRILRPRAVDGHDATTFRDLKPDSMTGKIEYDVDNDGDGITDSVWLDLGFPIQTDRGGKRFKPMFAFMVEGLNGKLPLNTAGNLNARGLADVVNPLDPTDPVNFVNEIGRPLFSHASHLGTSTSEINPQFALQAPFNAGDVGFGQVDDADVQVSLTQMRNILAGTRPQEFSGGQPVNKDANFVVNTQLTASNGGSLFWLPNNVLDAADKANDPINPDDRSRVKPVAGRWGEAEGVPQSTFVRYPATGNKILDSNGNPVLGVYNSFVGPGRSILQDPMQPGVVNRVDGHDDNFDGLDFWNQDNPNPPPPPPQSPFLPGPNLTRLAGALSLPSERRRYFVTPMDLFGIGRVIRYDGIVEREPVAGDPVAFNTFEPFDPSVPAGDFYRVSYGPDAFGRVSFLHYHRPPGVVPGLTKVNDQLENNVNLYHGHESQRVPLGKFAAMSGAAPYNVDTGQGSLAPPLNDLRPPVVIDPATFDTTILSSNVSAAGIVVNPFSVRAPNFPPTNPPTPNEPDYPPNGWAYNVWAYDRSTVDPAITTNIPATNPALNDPDEMQLYRASPHDEPFTGGDLHWLYRSPNDTSLDSRLALLAPASFTNTVPPASPVATASDGDMRRKMFTTETWDLNNFAMGVNPTMRAVLLNAGASLDYTVNITDRRAVQWDPSNGDPIAWVPIRQVGLSVAQRDRRINLNHPLPLSNDPEEPIRQKWIRETYELLKRIVPPSSIDTPEKLARLSQYVVNLVDFRDPDAAMTRFVNTDIVVIPPASPDQYPVLSFRPLATGADPEIGDIAGKSVPPYSTNLKNGRSVDPTTLKSTDVLNHNYLEQFGMEYSPIAINEILAFSFQRNEVGVLDTPRLFVEVVNMLTRDGHTRRDLSGNEIEDANSSNLNLSAERVVIPDPDVATNPPIATLAPLHYEMVIAEDNVYGRPDRTTGQILTDSTNEPTLRRAFWPIRYEKDVTPDDRYTPAMDGGGPDGNGHYYVFGNTVTETITQVTDAQTGELLTIIESTYDPVVHESANKRPRVESPSIPNAFFPQMGTGVDVVPATPEFFWLHLRRPANPALPIQEDPTLLIQTNPALPNFNLGYNPGVVVDAIRFPYSKSDSVGTPGSLDTVTVPTQELYSVERLQPYRGGQVVPTLPMPAAGTPPTVLDFAYGYSEQHHPGKPDDRNWDTDDHPTSNENDAYYGKFGNAANASTLAIGHSIGQRNARRDGTWDHFPFNDRDFHSVAEMLLVPGCPPGLFTKQFVENAADNDNDLTTVPLNTDPNDTSPAPHLFYEYDPVELADTVTPPLERPDDRATIGPVPPSTTNRRLAVVGQRFQDGTKPFPPPTPRVYPYLVDRFYYNHIPDQNHLQAPLVALGDQDGGWHQMLEFFEVPPSLDGAIGEVAFGNNGDWVRQDRRPGQLNLNLIIDEEVFFGLMDDPRLSLDVGGATFPKVVTQIDANGSTNNSYPIADRGFTVLPPLIGASGTMKAAFADFLRLVHGSNDLFSYRGQDLLNGFAGYRPFRSLSHPDINSTILRPAAIFPFPAGLPTGNTPPMTAVLAGARNDNPNMRYGGGVDLDPDTPFGRLLPQIPPRRLFQLPDADLQSNASQTPQDPAGAFTANYSHNVLGNMGLVNELANLFEDGAGPNTNALLGANTPPTLPNNNNYQDLRQHPYFRTEMLQKVMNLTTVRTHQYAVWVTVGYFEVIQEGNPQLAGTNPGAAYDKLGAEMVGADGNVTRHREFFVIDRTRATGFNPQDPGDFRELITYRRRID